MNKFPWSPWVSCCGRFKFFHKFMEIFAALRAPLLSTAPVTNGKIYDQKSCRYFNSMWINFFFKFTLRCKQSDIVTIICHWSQQHQQYQWQIYSRCHWRQWQICHCCCRYQWCILACGYLRKFLQKYAISVFDTGWCTLTCKYLPDFSNNLKLPSYFQGLRIRWFMKKPEAKNLVALSPFSEVQYFVQI